MSTDPRIEPMARAIDPDSWRLADDPRYAHLPPEDPGRAARSIVRISIEQATAALAAAEKVASIAAAEDLDSLAPGARIVLGDSLLLRMEEVVDESSWLDLENGCPVDPESLRLILQAVGPARVIDWGQL